MARYQEIAADLRRLIKDGVYPPNTKLPGYEGLCEKYGVGRGVISSALGELEREGLIRVVMKSGIHVREQLGRRRVPRTTTVTRDPRRGYLFPAAASPDEPWETHGKPRCETVAAPEEVALLLGVNPGDTVTRRHRVTSPTGEPPFQIVNTYFTHQAIQDAPQIAEPETGPGGYLDRLEEAGHGPIEWTETSRPRMPTAEEAKLLKMPPALPVMVTFRVGRSGRTGEVLEATVVVIPGDRVEYVSPLIRDQTAQWPTTPVAPA